MTRPFSGSTSGLTQGQLRTRRYTRLRRDVYVLTPAALSVASAFDAAVTLTPDAVASHSTAAQLLGLPVPSDRRLHITRPPGSGVSKHAETRTHRAVVPPDDVVLLDGRLVTTPARTFLDLAGVLREIDLVVLADAVLRRDPRVAERLRRSYRVRGVRRAKAALALADPRSDSPAETRTRLILHAAGFSGLRHGLDVTDDLGGWLARPDLADPAAKVAVQYDGLVHLGDDPEQRRADIDRDELLRQEGWQVVVLTAVDLRDTDRMVRKVAAAYARAAT